MGQDDHKLTDDEILAMPGFVWAKKQLLDYDHTRLRSLLVTMRYPSTDFARTKKDYLDKTAEAVRMPVQIEMEMFKDQDAYAIEVFVHPWDLPWPTVVFFPVLYRRVGGKWHPGADSVALAKHWDHEVLDAYAALSAAPDSGNKLGINANNRIHDFVLSLPLHTHVHKSVFMFGPQESK